MQRNIIGEQLFLKFLVDEGALLAFLKANGGGSFEDIATHTCAPLKMGLTNEYVSGGFIWLSHQDEPHYWSRLDTKWLKLLDEINDAL